MCCYTVVVPQRREVILPSTNDPVNRTPEEHVFICGVTEMNVVDFNSTWRTPSGESIEAFGTTRIDNGRLSAENLAVSLNPLNFVSSLTVRELSYEDDGALQCFISYTLNDSESVIQTGNTSINFQLLGMFNIKIAIMESRK